MIMIIFLIAVIGWIIGISSGYGSIWSPIGMLIVTIALTLLINPFFEKSELNGWFMAIISLGYLIFFGRAIQLYIRHRK